MNKKNKVASILVILGIIFTLIGSTFAYFNATLVGNAPVNATSYKFDLSLNVNLVNPSTAPSHGYNLVPLDESDIPAAISGNCTDNDGYAACRIYELVFTNNSGQAVTLNGQLAPTTNTFTNLKYSTTAIGAQKSTLTAGNDLGTSSVTAGFQNLTIPIGTSRMYVMIYLNSLNTAQPINGNATLNAAVSFVDASGGNQLYAQFGPDYVYTGYNGTNATIGQPISVTTYQSPEAAMAALKTAGDGTTNYPFFLAHVLGANDNVSESYVGFVVTSEMAASNPGMVAGTYYLRGGDNGASFVENAKTIYDAFGGVGCYLDGNSGGNPYTTTPSSFFYCKVSGLLANANSNGNVSAAVIAGFDCGVDSGGVSNCVVNVVGGGGEN